LDCTLEAIVGGDARVSAISAASILAKTCRDAMMQALDACYPGFELAIHKGYGTPAHLDALRGRAPSPLHRRSFSPVRCSVSEQDDDEALLQLLGIEQQEPG
jgi:ribonuclease HII